MASVIRIKPLHYIHVLDNNKNVTTVEVGPQTFTRQDHEKVVEGPSPMIIIPPRKYCIIDNPVDCDDEGNIVVDANGNAVLRHGDQEIRFHGPPFALYPGEKLNGRVSPLQVVAPNRALRLKCLRDFEEKREEGEEPIKRTAGEEWLWVGPGTYKPMVEVQVLEIISATLIKPNEALRLRAIREFVDRNGNRRDAGEEWLYKIPGAYLPDVNEEIVATVRAEILTETKAISLRATRTFKDANGNVRKAGSEWLVTNQDAEVHLPDVFEEVIGPVRITTLNERQFAVVMDPADKNGVPQLGKKELRTGPCSFFLLPGERLESGIQNIKVLGRDEALLLSAREAFVDEGDVERKPGDRWMIYGPRDYVNPVEVDVLETRRSIPLDDTEGIYVRDVTTGKVSSIIGRSYMLKPNEELWEKKLPPKIEDLVGKYGAGDGVTRDPTRVVTIRAPHNTAVQIYDYKDKQARVVFGPDLIMLGPDEHFTLLSLSGDTPKRPHVVKDLCLRLGPEFSTDVVTVETADHARLSLKLSYNWYFDCEKKTGSPEAEKIFVVPDFIGDFCKAIASRVRGAVAQASFDSFHKNSAKIIRTAVFGVNESGRVKNKFVFTSNNLVITNIDIQSVEPVDQRTRDSLQKSVQLAIEITTKSQEASARHAAEREEQEARGRLERQKITDEAQAEKARKELLSLQAASATVETTGQATAEAKARAASAKIEGEASVKQSELKAQSLQIKSEAELETRSLSQETELTYTKEMDELDIRKARELSEIEAGKFRAIVNSIGADTIESIAQAGPEMQAKLLEGLGLQSFLITDGNSPINLFNTAEGLIGSPQLD